MLRALTGLVFRRVFHPSVVLAAAYPLRRFARTISKDSPIEEMNKLDENGLLYHDDHLWDKLSEVERTESQGLATDYMHYLKSCHIAADRVKWVKNILEARGFKELTFGSELQKLQPGSRVYYVNKNANLAAFIVGQEPVTSGMNLLAGHADSPCLDLKVKPVYEDEKSGTAMLKTHYYGGIKTYQWGSIPLAMVGQVAKLSGETVDVSIGLEPEDPVLSIPDILPHLSKKVQNSRTATEVLKGEELNAILGGFPVPNANKSRDRFKLNALNVLFKKYGIKEEDLCSADLHLIPAIPPRFVGLDYSFIGGRHDDGICCYLMTKAFGKTLDAMDGETAVVPTRTTGIVLYDKEEVGSTGSTGAQSNWLGFCLSDVVARCVESESQRLVHAAMSRSHMISADVGDALNPNFPSVHDPLNCSSAGRGAVVERYTGHGGKLGTSEASPKLMAFVRRLSDESGIPIQYGSLGRIDEGGGGTIAHYAAEKFNCDVVDIGPAIMNMHSIFELVHTADLYGTMRIYEAFMKATSAP